MRPPLCWALAFLLLVGYCHAASFLAAVIQHDPVVTGTSPTAIVAANFQRYGEAAKQAAMQNASIAVFPEFGLGMDCVACTSPQQQNDFCEAAAYAPGDILCGNSSLPIASNSSCLARDSGLWVSINTCEAAYDGNYNTNLVFDDQGAFVAKYRKSHPWFVKVKLLLAPSLLSAHLAHSCCAVLREAGRGGSGCCPAAICSPAWHLHLLRHSFLHSVRRACPRRDSPFPLQFSHSYHWLRGSELLVPTPPIHPDWQQYAMLFSLSYLRLY
jgi:hypothetical protein